MTYQKNRSLYPTHHSAFDFLVIGIYANLEPERHEEQCPPCLGRRKLRRQFTCWKRHRIWKEPFTPAEQRGHARNQMPGPVAWWLRIVLI